MVPFFEYHDKDVIKAFVMSKISLTDYTDDADGLLAEHVKVNAPRKN